MDDPAVSLHFPRMTPEFAIYPLAARCSQGEAFNIRSKVLPGGGWRNEIGISLRPPCGNARALLIKSVSLLPRLCDPWDVVAARLVLPPRRRMVWSELNRCHLASRPLCRMIAFTGFGELCLATLIELDVVGCAHRCLQLRRSCARLPLKTAPSLKSPKAAKLLRTFRMVL